MTIALTIRIYKVDDHPVGVSTPSNFSVQCIIHPPDSRCGIFKKYHTPTSSKADGLRLGRLYDDCGYDCCDDCDWEPFVVPNHWHATCMPLKLLQRCGRFAQNPKHEQRFGETKVPGKITHNKRTIDKARTTNAKSTPK